MIYGLEKLVERSLAENAKTVTRFYPGQKERRNERVTRESGECKNASRQARLFVDLSKSPHARNSTGFDEWIIGGKGINEWERRESTCLV